MELFNMIMRVLGWIKSESEKMDHTSRYHSETYYQHVMLVIKNVLATVPSVELLVAAVMHDIGKPGTHKFREGKGNTFYNHDELGARMLNHFCTPDFLGYDIFNRVRKLVEYHMLPFQVAGPEPWASYAAEKLDRIRKYEGQIFMRDLFTLHDADKKACNIDITDDEIDAIINDIKNFCVDISGRSIYYMDIVGDCTCYCKAYLTPEEANGITRMLAFTRVDGSYAPVVDFCSRNDFIKIEKERIEEQNFEIEKALGLDQATKTSMQLAFEKAKRKGD